MVNRRGFPVFLITLFWMLAANLMAAETLSVEPDRKRLYEGEVLTLTVKGTTKIDINLSNLFDFDVSNLPKPDIDKVADDFEILGENQRYSIRTVNSQMIGEITWTYQLAPKKNGRLTIPSLSFRDAVSDPVTIEVVDGSPPDQGTDTRESFIELSADKDEVYVQEQMILTVKLFFNGNMIRGELSEPTHPNVIIESLGKQTEYTRYRDGVRYRVVERRYALFPQKPGELTLPPIRFEGQARDASGRLKFLRNNKELFPINVRAVPAEFSGDTWLPATDLSLSESGLPVSSSVQAGQNLSRELSLVVEGLPGEALPPFPETMPEGIRAYPEKPDRTTVPTKQGLTAKLAQTSALVPVKGGELTLPEIRIPWWDTKTDSEKVAVIPARTLTIQAAPGESTGNDVAPAEPEAVAKPDEGDTPDDAMASTTSTVWPLIALVLLIGWSITGLAWWWSRRSTSTAPSEKPADKSEKALFKVLCEAAEAGAPETPDHLIRWVNHRMPENPVVSVAEACNRLESDDIRRELARLQNRHYGRGEAAASPWNGKPLVSALENARAFSRKEPEAVSELPPLYPSELGSR